MLISSSLEPHWSLTGAAQGDKLMSSLLMVGYGLEAASLFFSYQASDTGWSHLGPEHFATRATTVSKCYNLFSVLNILNF